jgi:hypothetical protein
MIRLTFTLRKPSENNSAGLVTSWAQFKVHGVLQLDGDRLVLEWAVTASTGAVDGMDVRMNTAEHPPEALELPLERLYEAKSQGGWWRPQLALIANDLTLFQGVPGADGATLRLYVARPDRKLAAHVADEINSAIYLAQETGFPSPLPPA